MEVHGDSDMHHAKIQKADLDAWKKFDEAGTIVTRLSQADVEAFTKLAVPLWYNWANKDKNAARIFQIHLDYMMSGSLGYVTPDMIKGTLEIHDSVEGRGEDEDIDTRPSAVFAWVIVQIAEIGSAACRERG